MKRGQITMFVLLGLVVFATAVFLLVTEKMSVPVDPSKAVVRECMRTTLEEGIAFASLRSGMVVIPEGTPLVTTGITPLPVVGSMDDALAARHLEAYVDTFLTECIGRQVPVAKTSSRITVRPDDVVIRTSLEGSGVLEEELRLASGYGRLLSKQRTVRERLGPYGVGMDSVGGEGTLGIVKPVNATHAVVMLQRENSPAFFFVVEVPA